MNARASSGMLLSRNGLIRQTVSKIGIIRQARPMQLFFSTINKGKDESLSVLTQGFQPTAFTAEGVYIGSTYLASPPQTLPELDVSALTIDPKEFFTDDLAGLIARRGWEQKRRILMDTMKTELSINKESKKMYIVRNQHGAPIQLLQHHLDIADQWLDEADAMELTVENLYGTMHMDRFAIKAYDGIDRFSLMPYKWTSDMELLVTAMNRLATQLAALVFLPGKNSYHPPEDSDVDTQGKAVELSKCKQWTVVCYGRNLLPQRLLPLVGDIAPVVEFIPAEGRVCIRLQGKVSAGKEGDEAKLVSLVFNSVFEKRLYPNALRVYGNFL